MLFFTEFQRILKNFPQKYITQHNCLIISILKLFHETLKIVMAAENSAFPP